ncbi:MAG: hypothetical protein V1902_00220 [Candidatus Falkowbacteria bacterium]
MVSFEDPTLQSTGEAKSVQDEQKGKKDAIISPERALEESRAFYQRHNFAALLDKIPESIILSDEARKKIEEAQKQGFDRMMIMPDIATQNEQTKEIVTGLVTDKPSYYNALDQHSRDSENWHQHLPKNRPEGKPYMFLYKSTGVEPETLGKTHPEAEAYLKEHGWTGLALQEAYLIMYKDREDNPTAFANRLVEYGEKYGSYLLDESGYSQKYMTAWSKLAPDPDTGERAHEYQWSNSFGGNRRDDHVGTKASIVIEL